MQSHTKHNSTVEHQHILTKTNENRRILHTLPGAHSPYSAHTRTSAFLPTLPPNAPRRLAVASELFARLAPRSELELCRQHHPLAALNGR